MDEHINKSDSPGPSYVRKIIIVVSITTGFLVSVIVIWFSIKILLAAFGGVLLAIFLRRTAAWMSGFTRIPIKWSVGTVLVCLGVLTGFTFWILAPDVIDQAQQLREQAPEAYSAMLRSLENSKWGREMLRQVPSAGEVVGKLGEGVAYIGSMFAITMDMLVGLTVFVFVGLYFALSPEPYIQGLFMLIPPVARSRTKNILEQVGHVLYKWIIGRLLSMAVVGVLTGIGLWILGIPLVFFLALIAALLAFIPNIGPVLSLIPAVLVGLMQGGTVTLMIVALYVAVQFIESYAITPFIQQEAVRIPPAVIILAQVIMGILLGGPGLLLATPLTAMTITLVRILYVERINDEN